MKNSQRNSVQSVIENLEARMFYSVSQTTADITLGDASANGAERFGQSVAAAGDYVVVGEQGGDLPGATAAGLAQVYDASGTLIRTIQKPGTAVLNDNFGKAVDVNSNGDVLVGSLNDDLNGYNAGAAYLFDNTGALTATFANPTPGNTDQFGNGVSFVGDKVLIGCAGDDTKGTNAGAAYLFDRSGTLLATYYSPTPLTGGGFGQVVTGVGSNPVVGAWYENRLASHNGAVYMYDGSATGTSNTPSVIFNNPNPAVSDFFGRAVDGDGTRLLVGCDGDDTVGLNAGAAYLFDSSGTLIQTFLNADPNANAAFGNGVALSGTKALIGATGTAVNGAAAGAGFLFDTNSGVCTHIFYNPTPAPVGAIGTEAFGASIAISGNNAVIGAAANDEVWGVDVGAVYIYTPQ